METLSLRAEAGTRKSESPSGARAGTSIRSATDGQGTNCFRPVSTQPLPLRSARVVVACGSQSSSRSIRAKVARAPPLAMAGSQRFF